MILYPMKGENKPLLLSMDFRSGKGGIARVARLVYECISFNQVYSLHGKDSDGETVKYFNQNKFLLALYAYWFILFKRPSIIFCDHLYLTRLLVFVPKIFLKKVIVFMHDEEAWKEMNTLHKLALKKVTHILCNSEFTKKKFIANNHDFINKTYTCLLAGVPQGFSQTTHKASDNFNNWFNDPRPYCLFVSRLWKVHPYKGYWELISAFKKYHQNSANVKLRLAIVGNGDDYENIELYLKENNLSGYISVLKDVNDNDLAEFYRRSFCLFFPSIREGFGMVYLEAMFFGKACIGVKDQPAEEIIINNKTGILLEDNSESELCRIIKDMESDPQKYIQFGVSGYERYKSFFTNSHFKKRFLSNIK